MFPSLVVSNVAAITGGKPQQATPKAFPYTAFWWFASPARTASVAQLRHCSSLNPWLEAVHLENSLFLPVPVLVADLFLSPVHFAACVFSRPYFLFRFLSFLFFSCLYSYSFPWSDPLYIFCHLHSLSYSATFVPVAGCLRALIHGVSSSI